MTDYEEALTILLDPAATEPLTKKQRKALRNADYRDSHKEERKAYQAAYYMAHKDKQPGKRRASNRVTYTPTSTDSKCFFVPIGKPIKGVQPQAMVCGEGRAKLEAHDATLHYKKAEQLCVHGAWRDTIELKKARPRIRAKHRDKATGKTVRKELGRFLLGSKLPVAHLNNDPLDFRLENLVAQETDRQKAIHQRAAEKRATRKERSERWKEKRAADHARSPRKEPDGLTPAEQETKLCSPAFQDVLRKMALRYIPDAMRQYTDTRDVVNEVMPGLLKRVRAGKVGNVRAYSYFAVRTQARTRDYPKQFTGFDENSLDLLLSTRT
jgi:hypothetical protein